MKKFFGRLYFWVLVAIIGGVLLGVFAPEFAVQLKPFGDGFISLIKMLIGPVIFCTIVLGISKGGDLKKVGRVAGKAILYFEVVSTFALAMGLCIANFLKPGRGFNVDPATLDPNAIKEYAQKAHESSVWEFILNIIPKTFFEAFTASGNLLQILLIALLFGYAINSLGSKAQAVHDLVESASHIFFKIVNLVMKLAPLGAGGAMAFTIGKYGVKSLAPMLYLMGCFYLTCILFVIIVLGAIAHLAGFNIFKFIFYLREELLTVLGTSSSESGLAPLMEKLEKLGCSKSVVGLVVPSGYSFNLDGTNIYLTLATLFVAQALGIDLTLGEQLSVLLVAILTSKGASGLTGAGFITLAATLVVVPKVPVAGLALILGVDRFMSEARALTNFVGNGVATIVISRWENELNAGTLEKELNDSGFNW